MGERKAMLKQVKDVCWQVVICISNQVGHIINKLGMRILIGKVAVFDLTVTAF